MTSPPTIEVAFERFQQIVKAVPAEDDLPLNEANSRIKLIDPILMEVLGWSRAEDLWVELSAGSERLDYLLRDESGHAWFVIEAKRCSTQLAEPKGTHDGRTFKLTGPVLKPVAWPIISKQMAPYLGQYMPFFGGLTNGEQWIGFLGKTRPDDLPFDQTESVLFRSLEDIEMRFEQFYNCFSKQGARSRFLERMLVRIVRGVVRCPRTERVVPPDRERFLSYQADEAFYHDLRSALDAAFRPIQDDPEALNRCFVESRESREADSRLERLALELTESLLNAEEDYPPAVENQVRVLSEPPSASHLPGGGYLARLIGEPSAGKSVFLSRFYNTKLADKRSRIVLISIDGEKIVPFDPLIASREALNQLRMALFGDEGPEWAQFREVYRRAWLQRARLLGFSDSSVPDDEKKMFIAEQSREETEHPDRSLISYGQYTVNNRRRLPCIVLDNIDRMDDPAQAIAWALSLHRNLYALTTVAIEDTTVWKMRQQSRDDIAAHSPTQFWLYRPKVREVIENRSAYLRDLVADAATSSGSRLKARIGLHRQLTWSTDPDSLVQSIGAVLLDDIKVAEWLGRMCNHDIREVLELCKQVLLSPHVKLNDLLCGQVARTPFTRRSVLKALVAPRSEQFQGEATTPVLNVLSFWSGDDWAPLLPARILALLRGREDDERNRKEAQPGFVRADRLMFLFGDAIGTPSDVLKSAIERLKTLRLIEPYDPSESLSTVTSSTRVRITERGRLLLDWCLQERTYLRLMAEVDPLVDSDAVSDLRELWNQFIRAMGTGVDISACERAFVARYVEYVLATANKVCPLPQEDELHAVQDFEDALRDIV